MFKGKSNSYIRMNSLDPLQRANLGNYYTVFGYKDPNLWAGFTGAISPIQAFNIDSKIDDAKPLSGKVRAFGPNSAPLYVGYNPGGGLALPASEPWSAAGTYLRYCIDGNGINGDADDPYYVDDSNQTQLGCMLSISAPF
jgi:hypothetical protein